MKLYWNVLRAEGAAAAARRFSERWAEERRRRSYPADDGRTARAAVLNVIGSPLARRLGGVPIQLLDRLAIESRERAVAVLSAGDRGALLEVHAPDARFSRSFDRRPRSSPFDADPDLERAIEEAASRVEARVVHVEGLAGLPLASVRRLAARGVRLVLSIHDFALFCARPHLLEAATPPRFCGFSVDPARCARCLGAPASGLAVHRSVAIEVLSAAEARVFPSEYLRAEHGRLFPTAARQREIVVAPALASLADRAEVRAIERPRHVALLGSVTVPKGGALFAEVVTALRAERAGGLRVSAFGGGDASLLRRLRDLGVRVHGYHRAGSLTERLREAGVDLALALSIVPESFGLTLSESWAAGVPVLAFDHGAMAERIRASGGGLVVGPVGDARSVIEAVRAVVAGERTSRAATVAIPTAAAAAAAMRSLYEALGLVP